jgi:hypothetical protein
VIRTIELKVELQLRFFQLQVGLQPIFSVASDVATRNDASVPLDCSVICANSELHLRYDNISLLSIMTSKKK